MMAEGVEARRFVVSGLVQGVGYRFFANRAAARIGISGYVKNLRNGNVEVYAIGTREQLAVMKAELEQGPRAASVSAVDEQPAALSAEYQGRFAVEHDW